MSPGKKVQLYGPSNLKQLKEIQNLRDKTIDEFQAEKDTILTILRELK